MKQISYIFAVVLLALAMQSASATEKAAAPKVQFNRDIRPILADNCFHCHGADSNARKAKLRLDREEGLLEKRKDGAIVERGDAAKSLLYQRIMSKEAEDLMPPAESHKQLKDEEKELFKRWIDQGAQWESHWAFIKPVKAEMPVVQNTNWARLPFDNFVLAKLEKMGLSPAPEADKRTLARRLSLDLTGLPPEPEVVDAFVADTAPNAYEAFADKLIASPRYGEHRARYWLDAARYADTHGMHFDNYREMWPFRDWVINAFNVNQPFDKFTVEQLAGDLLPNPTKEQLIATGFHRCNITTNEGGTIEEENLANYARDRVETTSWVWLGLTANCCVCHDHKFDPLTTKEFYSMTAYFRNTTQGGLDGNIKDTAPILVMTKPEDEPRFKAIPAEIEAANKQIGELKKKVRGEFDKWLADVKPTDWEALLEKDAAPMLSLPLTYEAPAAGAKALIKGHEKGAAFDVAVAEEIKWEDGGKLGKAPVLGAKKVLNLGDRANFDTKDSFSFGCWVKLPKDSKENGAVMSRMDDTNGFAGWDLWFEGNEFASHIISKWDTDALKVSTKGNALKRGQWQHVMVTYDGSSKADGVKIVVDGKDQKLKVDKNVLKGSIKSGAPLLVGQRKTTSPLPAGSLVQDIRVYDRRLQVKEIQRLAVHPHIKALLAKAPKDRVQKDKDEIFETYSSSNDEIATLTDKLSDLENERKAIRDRSVVTHIQEEKKNSMAMANVLFRGEYDKKKDKVEPGVFGVLHPMPQDAPKNRLGLAQWIVSPENPLTARVIVNRFWQELYGTGIVKTAEDLGTVGEPPTNQQLLDYLAVEFRDGGWDVKKLIKSLVMSATYRQAAVATKEKIEKDPANRYFSRGPRFRMDAEMVRDYALTSSGLLSSKIGGPSVKPYQPEGVWEVVGMKEGNTQRYVRDNGDALYRRSIYDFWKRMAPPASLDIFNAPSRETACVRRERTNTPLQALVTLNDPQFVEAARVLAEKAIKSDADENARLNFIAK